MNRRLSLRHGLPSRAGDRCHGFGSFFWKQQTFVTGLCVVERGYHRAASSTCHEAAQIFELALLSIVPRSLPYLAGSGTSTMSFETGPADHDPRQTNALPAAAKVRRQQRSSKYQHCDVIGNHKASPDSAILLPSGTAVHLVVIVRYRYLVPDLFLQRRRHIAVDTSRTDAMAIDGVPDTMLAAQVTEASIRPL